jgi:serine phosphatase RsbU (regulator of sigma subunit)
VPPYQIDALVRDGRLLGSILDAAHTTTPDGLAPLLVREAAAVGLTDLVVHLQDYDQLALLPLDSVPRPDEAEPVEGTLAGRAFATHTPVELSVESGVRLWLPLLDGANRVGVLALTAPHVDDAMRRTTQRLAGLVAQLLVTKGQYSDLLFRARRRRPTTLAAEMQWQLLPPLMMETPELAIAGVLEPAYEVGGDSFDYALNGTTLHLGIFDAMGHGLRAATMSAVVLGAYRHARRNGVDLAAKYAQMDAAIADQFGDDHFATAQLAHLDSVRGGLTWFNAGHPRPMLIRSARVIRSLRNTPTLPIGLGGGQPQVATEQLEPGDRVLFFTDGVVEQEAPDGDQLGFDRLADHVERQSAAGLSCPETVRRIAAELLKPAVGLRDDATLLLVEWKGPGQAAVR